MGKSTSSWIPLHSPPHSADYHPNLGNIFSQFVVISLKISLLFLFLKKKQWISFPKFHYDHKQDVQKSKTLQGQRNWERKQQNLRSKKADGQVITDPADQKNLTPKFLKRVRETKKQNNFWCETPEWLRIWRQPIPLKVGCKWGWKTRGFIESWCNRQDLIRRQKKPTSYLNR